MLPTVALISFVLPAYREASNVRTMVDRIDAVRARLAPDVVEAVFVDDHSSDATPVELGELHRRFPWVRWARLARRSGSHRAALCGLQLARGACAIILASDGQDPPELAPELVARWRAGVPVVWGTRRSYERNRLDRLFAAAYYRALSALTDLRLPPNGADVVLLDRRVVETLTASRDSRVALWESVAWLGLAEAYVPYDKGARVAGVSGWTFRKKARTAIDNLLGFSPKLLRVLTGIGVGLALLSLLLAGLALVGAAPAERTLFFLILSMASAQMLVLAVIGEYVRRTFEQTSGRPSFVIEHCSDDDPSKPDASG